VEAAASAICRAGHEGFTVAEIMAEVGLTHGGFYAQFPGGKEELLIEATEAAMRLSRSSLLDQISAARPTERLEALVAHYLGADHGAQARDGCSFADFGCEIPRQNRGVRAISHDALERLLAIVEQTLPRGTTKSRKSQAALVLSSLVGGLILARAAAEHVELAARFTEGVPEALGLAPTTTHRRDTRNRPRR
jgi:AcrR family transcriptional regulator